MEMYWRTRRLDWLGLSFRPAEDKEGSTVVRFINEGWKEINNFLAIAIITWVCS